MNVVQWRHRLHESNNRRDEAALKLLITELETEEVKSAQALRTHAQAMVCWINNQTDQAAALYQQAHDSYMTADDIVGQIESLCDLGMAEARIGKYEQARATTLSALRMSEEHDYERGQGVALSNLGEIDLQVTGITGESISNLQKAVAIGTKLADSPLHIVALIRLASILTDSGERTAALDLFLQAVKLADDFGVAAYQIAAANSLAILYKNCSMYPEAIALYQQAMSLAAANDDTRLMTIVAHNLASCSEHVGDYANAEYWATKALSIATEAGLSILVGVCHFTVSRCYLRKHDVDKAIDHVQSAIDVFTASNSPFRKADAEIMLAQYLTSKGEYEQARIVLDSINSASLEDDFLRINWLITTAKLLHATSQYDSIAPHLEQALSIAERIQRLELQTEIHHLFRELALANNDLASYVKHNDAYNRISDEIRGADVKTRIAMQEKEKEIAKEREEREREKALLYGALPKHIADRMLRGEDVSGDEHPSVSVLFMDIAGFTSHSQTLHPREVTELLDRLFEWIDKACTEHHVVKVKTIGDAYLAVAFPLSEEQQASEHATNVAHEVRITQVALQVMQHGLSWPDGSPVQVRIGLHTGAVVAGVIGTQRLQYDVWGDTVNTASRMESTSEPGRIHASDVFAQALAQHDSPYVCTPRGTIEVKGRGSMQTYWVEA